MTTTEPRSGRYGGEPLRRYERSSPGQKVGVSARESPIAPSCSGCRTPLPDGARFCPECGRPVVDGMDITAVVMPVRAHWFGIPSPTMLFGVSLLVAAAAIALVVIGNWPAGLIVAAIAMLLLTAFLESARRRPTGRVAALVVKAARGAKARGRLGLDLLVAQAHAGRETSRIKLQLRRILRRRRRLLAVFGEAVYRGDDPADARAQLETLEARTYELERELRRLAVHTGERIRHARAAAGNGQMVAVPEPYPPPDEGDLPGPVITPEPLPPPDEGTPPRPDPVPTPGPEPTPAK